MLGLFAGGGPAPPAPHRAHRARRGRNRRAAHRDCGLSPLSSCAGAWPPRWPRTGDDVGWLRTQLRHGSVRPPPRSSRGLCVRLRPGPGGVSVRRTPRLPDNRPVLVPPGRRTLALSSWSRGARLGRRLITVTAHTMLAVHGHSREKFSPLLYHVFSSYLARYLADILGRKPFQTHPRLDTSPGGQLGWLSTERAPDLFGDL